MARIDIPEGDGDDRERVWQLRPELGAAAARFSEAVQESTIIPTREHEAARIRIAHINGCIVCSETRQDDMAGLGIDESFYTDVDDPAKRGRYTEREALAIEFAERFAAGKETLDDIFWHRMRSAFSDAEILDLAASCAKWLGLGRLSAVLDLSAACSIRLGAKKSQAA